LQNPLHLNEDSVARPNLMLLRLHAGFYAQAHPRPGVVPPQAPPSTAFYRLLPPSTAFYRLLPPSAAVVDLAPLLAAS